MAAIPWRARQAEAYLIGRPAERESFEVAAQLELLVAAPLPDNAYKVKLIGNLTVDVLSELIGVSA